MTNRVFRTAPLAALLLLGAALPSFAQPQAEAKARLEATEAALDAWDLAGAKQALAALGKALPAGSEPLAYAEGRVAFEDGRYADAVAAFERAGVSGKPGGYLALARDTLALTKDHQKVESEHFVFYYPKGKDALLAPYALETLERMRAALVEDLGWAPPGGKVRVEVVNDARELAKVSTLTYEQIRTTGTIAICKFNKLMVTSPKAVAFGYDWQDTLAHEYTHLVVSQLSRNTVPIWLHEGMAKYLESRWRGKAGQAMSPSTLALLGKRVRQNKLVPFEKMHPSLAMLPTAEDAATAFAEVFFAVDYLHQLHGPRALRDIIAALRGGKSDRQAVEAAVGQPFARFESAWLAHVRKQPFPRELIPRDDKVVLKEDEKGKGKKEGKKEVSFGDFAEVAEVPARKAAHLGELMRERNRAAAAAELYARAHGLVGDKYLSVSNKYALALLELKRLDEAEKVLRGSLQVHPGVPQTNVHLGRLLLHRQDWKGAQQAYLEALATDPFDPEVHLALTRTHAQLGEKALADRARAAAAELLDLEPQDVDRVARALARDEASLTSPAPAAAAPQPGPGPAAARDAGR